MRRVALWMSLGLMVGSLSAGTPALLVSNGKGSVDVIPLKGNLPTDAAQILGQGGERTPGLLGIPDTVTYSTDPRYIYAGIDPNDTLATWFQCMAACTLHAVGYYVYLNTVSSAQMYAVVAPLAPGVDVTTQTPNGRGDYVDYHLGIDSAGPSPWDLANKYADAFTTVNATGITWLTLPAPVDVGTNIFVAGYAPLTTGTDGAGEPWMVISAGDQTNNYGWHSLVYQQDLASFGVSPGWYNNWHAHTIYAAVEYYENVPPSIEVVDLSDTYDRDGPYTITATITDLGVPADSGGVDPSTVFLHYSVDSGTTWDSVAMTLDSGDSTNGQFSATLDFTGSPLAPGTGVLYYVTATDIQGASAQSNQASFTVLEKTGEVLWILSDAVDDGIIAFYTELGRVLSTWSTKTFDVWQTAVSGLPDASVIVGDPDWAPTPYEAIIVTDFSASVVAADSALFAQYLDNGGNLMVISQDLFAGGFGYGGYNAPITLSAGMFAYDYLGISEAFDDFVGTDPSSGGLTANNDTTIQFLPDSADSPTQYVPGPILVYDNNLWMPYAYSVSGTGEDVLYDSPTQDPVAVANTGTNFKTYFIGAPVHYFVKDTADTNGDGVPETFAYSDSAQNSLLTGVLSWFFVVSVEEGVSPHARTLQLAVKPGAGSFTLNFALPTAGDVNISLYDAMGRRVKSLVKGRMEAGVHTVQVDAKDLASGLYFVRLDAAGKSLVKRVPVLR